ncbi:MAG: DUF4435 domain-containing protein [Actinomycetota bacterium]|nr:DUF4435 domain-containing protein [Actinomycetota bacterium]
MIDSLTKDDLFSTLLIMRGADPEIALLVVEGPSDSRLLKSFTDPLACQLVPGYGKESVLNAMILCNNNGLVGVLGIVDADFDWLLGSASDDDNIIYTDFHDWEMIIVHSGSLEKFVNNWLSREKVARFVGSGGIAELRQKLVEAARPLGALRLYAQLADLPLDFNLRLERVVNPETLEIDVERLVETVLQRSGISLSCKSDVLVGIGSVLSEDQDPKQLCCGHDVLFLVWTGLKRALASRAGAELPTPDHVERTFRTGYDLSDLLETNVFARIIEWEERNPPFVILKRAA